MPVKGKSTIYEVLDSFGQKVSNALINSLEKKASGGGGSASKLAGTIKYKARILGNDYQFELSLADYYKWLDKGRGITRKGNKPGKVKGKIEEWLNWKKLKPSMTYKTKTKLKGGQVKTTIRTYKTFAAARKAQAFFIARKIHRKGFKGNRFYSSVVNKDLIADLKKELANAAAKDIQIEIKDLTNVN